MDCGGLVDRSGSLLSAKAKTDASRATLSSEMGTATVASDPAAYSFAAGGTIRTGNGAYRVIASPRLERHRRTRFPPAKAQRSCLASVPIALQFHVAQRQGAGYLDFFPPDVAVPPKNPLTKAVRALLKFGSVVEIR